MLNEYVCYITSSDVPADRSMDILENSINNLKNIHKAAKANNGYSFKGVRKAWFPLLLLDRVVAWRTHGVKNEPLEELYKYCINTEVYHSFYIDKYERQGKSMMIYYRSRRNHLELIKQIIATYNITNVKVEAFSYHG